MTILEIVLIAIVWVNYGLYAFTKTTFRDEEHEYPFGYNVFFIMGAPIVFIMRAVYGAFKEYEQ